MRIDHINYYFSWRPILIQNSLQTSHFSYLCHTYQLKQIWNPLEKGQQDTQNNIEHTSHLIHYQILAACLVLVVVILWTNHRILVPLQDIRTQLNGIHRDKAYVHIIRRHNNFLEMDQLYTSFRNLIKIFKFGKNNQVNNEVDELIANIQAYSIFEHLQNWEGCGRICNNLGNIHLREQRFQEAIEQYDKAIAYLNEPSCPPDDLQMADYHATMINRKHMKYLAMQNIAKQKQEQDQVEDQALGIDILLTLQDIVDSLDQHPGSSIKKISMLLSLAQWQGVVGHIQEWRTTLGQAKHTLVEYQQQEVRQWPLHQKYFLQRVDPFVEHRTDAMEQVYLLENNYHLQMAKCLLEHNNHHQAAQQLYSCLTHHPLAIPQEAAQCLHLLHTILSKGNHPQQLASLELLAHSMSQSSYIDVLFMLDVSESMDFLDKKLLAIREILVFFDDFMSPQDRVGFMRFNQNCYMDFDLSIREEGPNVFLRNVIQKAHEFTPEGSTCLYDSLNQALGACARQKDFQRKQYIICLTDGEDSDSHMSEARIKERLGAAQVTLVLIGIGIDDHKQHHLASLCKATPQGMFIQTPYDLVGIQQLYQLITTRQSPLPYHSHRLIYEQPH